MTIDNRGPGSPQPTGIAAERCPHGHVWVCPEGCNPLQNGGSRLIESLRAQLHDAEAALRRRDADLAALDTRETETYRKALEAIHRGEQPAHKIAATALWAAPCASAGNHAGGLDESYDPLDIRGSRRRDAAVPKASEAAISPEANLYRETLSNHRGDDIVTEEPRTSDAQAMTCPRCRRPMAAFESGCSCLASGEDQPKTREGPKPGDEVVARGRIERFDRTMGGTIVAEVKWPVGGYSMVPVDALSWTTTAERDRGRIALKEFLKDTPRREPTEEERAWIAEHKRRSEAARPVVWADDVTPFDGPQAKALLDENERLRSALATTAKHLGIGFEPATDNTDALYMVPEQTDNVLQALRRAATDVPRTASSEAARPQSEYECTRCNRDLGACLQSGHCPQNASVRRRDTGASLPGCRRSPECAGCWVCKPMRDSAEAKPEQWTNRQIADRLGQMVTSAGAWLPRHENALVRMLDEQRRERSNPAVCGILENGGQVRRCTHDPDHQGRHSWQKRA